MKAPYVPSVFDEFPSYKGGCTTICDGYVFEFVGTHHLANRWGFVAQHRLVMEDKLGRPLIKGEHVHHMDHCPTNNDPNNLEAMSRADHLKLHRPALFRSRELILDPAKVEKLLAKGGLKYAARQLHVHSQTLRNRFPELVAPYKRRRPTKIDDPKVIAFVIKVAADPSIGLRDVVNATGISAMTVLRICRRRGVMWVKQNRTGRVHRRTKAILAQLIADAKLTESDDQ